MRDYTFEKNWKSLLIPEVVAMLSQIHELKGAQNLYLETKPKTVSHLIEIAKIQSTKASNQIEGIYTSNDRLKRIVQEKTAPKNRDEEEIAGYRDVLGIIHENYEYIPIKPSIILQLHRDLYKFSGKSTGGSYKASDNQITETDEKGNRSLRFQPVTAWETPDAMEKLCNVYAEILNAGEADPLLIIPMFILDFLCIHPFEDGNGRMSRLLTLLMMYCSGFLVGKYISIESLIEKSKVTYYEALQESSLGWHEGKNDYLPFVRYMLGMILGAYREFEARVKVLNSTASKPERVSDVIMKSWGKITKSEILEQCPDISAVTVQRTLIDLQNKDEIIKIGGGRYTAYVWNREK